VVGKYIEIFQKIVLICYFNMFVEDTFWPLNEKYAIFHFDPKRLGASLLKLIKLPISILRSSEL